QRLTSVFSHFSPPLQSSLSPLSLHDALPISSITKITMIDAASMRDVFFISLISFDQFPAACCVRAIPRVRHSRMLLSGIQARPRSEEHTSELQSRVDLVCRLLLEKNKRYDMQ